MRYRKVFVIYPCSNTNRYDDKVVFATPLFRSQRFADYINKVYTDIERVKDTEDYPRVPLSYDLNEILYIWERSQRLQGLSPLVEDNKFLVSEYIEPPGEANVYSMKKLNPKKKKR